ncbi:phage tail sheath subtilisin-like domain-containing protein [Natrinema pallidum]|uniref:Phage tail sheath family protein n=1 Tax=Natrinema pallidum TaxID=69527 RepID=A0A4P9TBI3_9EURY|nr:phage tail sheath subtilisin-like domain-containing protein [Natrinema pallidum]QCW01991.1 phage tail sheath family protein [Natrinema pallidum]
MPEYLSPGVYVEEVDSGTKSVEGVSTSTAGFLGETERGPVEPKLVTSFSEFKRTFGSSPQSSDLDVAVDGFFKNGGSRCYVGRVTAAEPTDVATTTLVDEDRTDVISVEATGPGAWGCSIAAIVEDGPLYEEGENEYFKLTLRYWSCDIEEVSKPASDQPDPAPDIEEVYEDMSADPESSQFYEKQIPGSVLVDLEQLDAGRPAEGLSWLSREVPDEYSDGGLIQLDAESETAAYVPEELDDREYSELQGIAKPFDIDATQSREDLLEDLEKVQSGEKEVEVDVVSDLSSKPRSEDVSLSDYEGINKPGMRTGLAAFRELDGVSLMCVPDHNDIEGLTESLVAHCENMGERFAILQAPQNAGSISDIETPVDSSYAAYYYPWIETKDPFTNRKKLVPPGGHITGIFARSDAEHGVHKAPANEVVRGILGVQHNITKGEQDVLNPKGVNCIRSFQGRGIRLWGARTTSSDPSWKYVNVRRLFLYIEQSIDEGTQWAVFEPNDEDLWARVRQSAENFLTTVWRDGGLQGSTADEAFYVKCGEETMTQDDIDNGRLIVEIGVAPVKPAEFVVFRISQDTGE